MLIFLSMIEGEEEQRFFIRLYQQYHSAMIRVALRYFPHDQSAAEDAVQNAWIRVIQNISKIQALPCKKRGAYLVIIVKNESISLLRKNHRDVSYEDAVTCEEQGGDFFGVLSVKEIIRKMPDTYRAVLEMRFVEERSTKEIAFALHLSESAVDTRIHRGRAKLIEALEKEGITL